jgi:hypothetical protein
LWRASALEVYNENETFTRTEARFQSLFTEHDRSFFGHLAHFVDRIGRPNGRLLTRMVANV